MVGTSMIIGACGGGDDPKPASTRTESTGPFVRDGVFDAKVRGAWRVLGEGRFLEIGERGLTQFEEARSICYVDRREALPIEIVRDYNYRRVEESDRVTVDIHLDGNPSVMTLERIPEVPHHCRQEPPTDPATVFKTMWEIFDLDYGFFKERHIDWAARFASLQQKAAAAANDDALQAVLTEALHDFNDYHVTLYRYKGDESIDALGTFLGTGNTPTMQMLRQAFAQQSEILSLDDFDAQWKERMRASMRPHLIPQGGTHALNDSMVWGTLPGNIGYVQLSRLAGFVEEDSPVADLKAIRAEMDKVIAALADTKAIILDIAVNDGGYDEFSAEVAGRFADRRRLAFTVQQHRPQGKKGEAWYVEPKGERQYLKPVYLLTTDRTVSAGDSLTLMMRELPHVTHVGQRTSGSMSDRLVKALPGNFGVGLSNESYFDAKGVLYEGRGIPPKVDLQVFYPSDPASLYTGHEAAIGKIMEMIGN